MMMMVMMMMMMMMEKSPSKTARLRLSDIVRLFGILQSGSNLLMIIIILVSMMIIIILVSMMIIIILVSMMIF